VKSLTVEIRRYHSEPRLLVIRRFINSHQELDSSLRGDRVSCRWEERRGIRQIQTTGPLAQNSLAGNSNSVRDGNCPSELHVVTVCFSDSSDVCQRRPAALTTARKIGAFGSRALDKRVGYSNRRFVFVGNGQRRALPPRPARLGGDVSMDSVADTAHLVQRGPARRCHKGAAFTPRPAANAYE
jgi:hypothetical protein